ncbi:hypothetical protein ABVK25_011897 [Lepraria finkii]|uniref:NAD(P)-binding domain-containing protein n=1 Tax=Lepraria finkii TaxID=1340010 RepID=A0ABR4AL64_9LECA
MRILILGGSGRTGELVIDEALKRGNTITALVRKPDSLKARADLTIVQGTPLEKADIEKAITATPHDLPSAIIITLNARRATDNPFSANISPTHDGQLQRQRRSRNESPQHHQNCHHVRLRRRLFLAQYAFPTPHDDKDVEYVASVGRPCGGG